MALFIVPLTLPQFISNEEILMQAPDPTLSLTGEHVVIEPMGERHLEGLAAAAADPTLWRYLPIAPPNSLYWLTLRLVFN